MNEVKPVVIKVESNLELVILMRYYSYKNFSTYLNQHLQISNKSKNISLKSETISIPETQVAQL